MSSPRSLVLMMMGAVLLWAPLAGATEAALTHKQIIALDEKALWAKKSGIQTLSVALKSRMATPQEPVLQLRLAEMYQDMAAIQFRLAYEKATDNANAKLDDYYATLKASLVSLNRIITGYPQWENVPRAFYLRSKAFSETDRGEAAIADLKHLVEVYPNSKDSAVGNMDLWKLLIARKQYTTAIQYINRYGLRAGDKYYSSALEKLSLCYFYLGDLSNAIHYTEVELKSATGVDHEKAMSNYALFYATAVDRKIAGFEPENALAHFQSLVKGDDLGKLGLSYVYLLRTKGLTAQLNAFKNQVASESLPDLYKNDIFLVVLEDQFNKHDFNPMKDTALREIALFNSARSIRSDTRRVAKVKSIFKDMIMGLQKVLIDTSNTSEVTDKTSETLNICYQFMLDTSEHDVVELARIHLNMALLSHQLKRFEDSVIHTRWVVEHLDFKNKDQSALYVTASSKAIESRYETLKLKNWVPKNLVAKPFKTDSSDVPWEVTEWMKWIDSFPEVVFLENKIDTDLFEANRIVYSYGHVEEATEKLRKFVKHYPTSTYAPAAASLILDTYIASEKWEEAYSIALDYSQSSAWTDSSFKEKLSDIGSDIYCKVLDLSYKSKDYKHTIANGENFVKEYPNSKRKADILELAANAALAMNDKAKAASLFNQMQSSGRVKPSVQALSYMTQGSMAEDSFDYKSAAQNYRNAAEMGPVASLELRNKTLLFAWLAGDPAELDAALGSTRVCPEPRDELCTSYERRFEETYESSPRHSQPWVRTPIAKVAIKERLSTLDRAEVLAEIPKEWDQLSSLDRSAVLPMLMRRVPEAFNSSRAQVRKYSSLSVDPKTISKRAKLLANVHAAAEKVAQLPWSRIQINVIRETAGLYDDAAEDLLAIVPPADVRGKDLKEFKTALSEAAAPFKLKSEELHKTEQELASHKGEFMDQAMSRRWVSVIHTAMPRAASSVMLIRFNEALEHGNWQLAGFLIGRAQEGLKESSKESSKEAVPTETITLMKASLLAVSGATAEAIEELKQLPSSLRDSVEAKLTELKKDSVRAPASNSSGGGRP